MNSLDDFSLMLKRHRIIGLNDENVSERELYLFARKMLNKINKLTNIDIKNEALKYFENEIKKHLMIKRLSKIKYLSPIIEAIKSCTSIEDIEQTLYEYEERNRSGFLFPEDIVFVYSHTKPFKSRKKRNCDMCGMLINPGAPCECYDPIVYNKSERQMYVLKYPIVVASECLHSLPDTILEMEWMQGLALNSYENRDIQSNIDPVEFARNGGFVLVKTSGLSRRNREK